MKKYIAEFIGTFTLVLIGCGTAMLVGCDAVYGCGYILTAKMLMSYMDFIIRHNMDDFREAGLIGTPFKNAQPRP